MSAAALLRQAHDEGLELSATPVGTIKLRGPREAVTRWTPIIVAHKPELLAELAKPGAVVSLDGRRAAVERLRDAMQAENERRRGWMSASPYDRDGNLTIRSILTGELTTIRLAKRGRT